MTKIACELVTACGDMPMALHLYFLRLLAENCLRDRAGGLRLGLERVELSGELWTVGD